MEYNWREGENYNYVVVLRELLKKKRSKQSKDFKSLYSAHPKHNNLRAFMEIFKQFTFDSAHWLPRVPDDHKCKNMHGHTYIVRFYVRGELDPQLGWVIDFADLKKIWKPLEKILDHKCLNDIPGLENPTAENIAIWLWRKVKPELPHLSRIDLSENPSSGVIYRGEFESI